MPSSATKNNYTTKQTLVYSSGEILLAKDIITGLTSGTVGLVFWVNGNNYSVAIISGPGFTAGGETTTNQDSDNTIMASAAADADTTGVVVYTGIEAPDSGATIDEPIDISETTLTVSDSSVFAGIEGSYFKPAGSLEIMKHKSITNGTTIECFRGQWGTDPETHVTGLGIDIVSNKPYREIAVAIPAVATVPSITDYNLKLDAYVFFGRSDEAVEITRAVSWDEHVDFLTDNALQTGTSCAGNSSYDSRLQLGDAYFIDGDDTELPLKTSHGCTIISAEGFSSNDDYGQIDLYNTPMTGNLSTSTSGMSLLGKAIIVDCELNETYTPIFGNPAIVVDNFKSRDCSGGFIINTSSQLWTNIRTVNNAFATFYIGTFEGGIAEAEFLNLAGTASGTHGSFGASATFPFDDCTVRFAGAQTFAADMIMPDRKSFQVQIVGANNDLPLENVKIRLLDKYGYPFLYEDSGEIITATCYGDDVGKNTTSVLSTSSTWVNSQSGHTLVADDVFSLGKPQFGVALNRFEFFKISSVTSTRLNFVGGRQWLNSGLSSSPSASNIFKLSKELDVSDRTQFPNGTIILADCEKMLVEDNSVNPIIVERGYQNSHASAHEIGITLYKIVDFTFTDATGWTDLFKTHRAWNHANSTSGIFTANTYLDVLNDFTMTAELAGRKPLNEPVRYGPKTGDVSGIDDKFIQSRKMEFIDIEQGEAA